MHLVLAIAAMIGYGLTSIIYKMASKDIDPVSLTLFTTLLMTPVIFIFWLFTKEKHITLQGFEYAGLAGIIAGLSFIAFITAIHLGKVSTTATLRGLSFLVTTIIAVLFLAEKITLAKALGIALPCLQLR